LWATDPAGFGQVGCVYTAQGFEYDYGGVIIGPDLLWRGDHWETSAAACRDRDLLHADNFDELIRNIYKVLLTRGLLGCSIYSVDDETQQMLAGLGITRCRRHHERGQTGPAGQPARSRWALARLRAGKKLGALPHAEEPRHGTGR
jgi:hypothetical protein